MSIYVEFGFLWGVVWTLKRSYFSMNFRARLFILIYVDFEDLRAHLGGFCFPEEFRREETSFFENLCFTKGKAMFLRVQRPLGGTKSKLFRGFFCDQFSNTFLSLLMLIYCDFGLHLGGRFSSILELFVYTFSGSLFMLIYVDFEFIWELILITFGVPKRAWEGKRDFREMLVFHQ